MKRNREMRPITYRNVLFFLGLFVLFGCPLFGGGNNPPRPTYIYIEGVPKVSATDETFAITVYVNPDPSERTGQSVIVTPMVPAGCTVTPATQTVVIPATGTASTTFNVRTPASGYLIGPISARRTDHTAFLDKSVFTSNEQTVEVVPNLVSITFDPSTLVMNRGTSASINVGVLPRGNTSGSVLVTLDTTLAGLTLSPKTFVVNLAQGSITPATQLVTVSASANAGPASSSIVATTSWSQKSYHIASLPITVNAGTGTPHFTFTATPSQVTSAAYQMSAPVTYTLTSVNGFSGTVVVSQQASGEVEIFPTSDDESLTVSPSGPTTLTRRFTRFIGTDDISVVFTATHQASATSRSVTTLVKNP